MDTVLISTVICPTRTAVQSLAWGCFVLPQDFVTVMAQPWHLAR